MRIRPARPSDRAQVRALYEGMWPETLKRRFFGAGDRLHEREADLDPVLARPDGVTALDCRVHLVRPHPPRPGRGTGPHAYPRRLR